MHTMNFDSIDSAAFTWKNGLANARGQKTKIVSSITGFCCCSTRIIIVFVAENAFEGNYLQAGDLTPLT